MKIFYLWLSLILALGAMGNLIMQDYKPPVELKYRAPIAHAQEHEAKDFPTYEIMEIDSKLQTIKRISTEHDMDWKVVKAICDVESNCNSDRVGDNGNSFGAYQIYRPAHPNITHDQACNFEWATEFTVKRLKRHENMGREEMIRSHNGLPSDMRNMWYVDRVKNRISQL